MSPLLKCLVIFACTNLCLSHMLFASRDSRDIAQRAFTIAYAEDKLDESEFKRLKQELEALDLESSVGRDQDISCDFARTAYTNFSEHFADAWQRFLNDKHVTPRLFYEYLRVVDKLLSDFPPSNYIYVGLGASPTMLFAILEDLHPSITTLDFPLSIREGKSDIVLTPHIVRYLHRIFSSTKHDPRKYLVVDYVFTGKSLERASKVLTQYFSLLRLRKEITPLGLRSMSTLFPPVFQPAQIILPRHVAYHIHEKEVSTYRKYRKGQLRDINRNQMDFIVTLEYRNLKKFLAALQGHPSSRL